MQAGKLRHRITFQKAASHRDLAGQNIQQWTDFATVSASVKQTTARQIVLGQADSVATTATYEIRTRFVSGVTVDMRIRWDGRTFTINQLDDIELRKSEFLIVCTEVEA